MSVCGAGGRHVDFFTGVRCYGCCPVLRFCLLARRSAIPVALEAHLEGRYEPSLEAAVYDVVAESITNAVKHAQASVISLRGGLRDDAIELEIEDDGVGGTSASSSRGSTAASDRR